MDSFFLFPSTPSPDHYRGLWKGWVCLLHTFNAQNKKEIKYHYLQPFIFIIILSNIQYAILIIILGRVTKTFFSWLNGR